MKTNAQLCRQGTLWAARSRWQDTLLQRRVVSALAPPKTVAPQQFEALLLSNVSPRHNRMRNT